MDTTFEMYDILFSLYTFPLKSEALFRLRSVNITITEEPDVDQLYSIIKYNNFRSINVSVRLDTINC